MTQNKPLSNGIPMGVCLLTAALLVACGGGETAAVTAQTNNVSEVSSSLAPMVAASADDEVMALGAAVDTTAREIEADLAAAATASTSSETVDSAATVSSPVVQPSATVSPEQSVADVALVSAIAVQPNATVSPEQSVADVALVSAAAATSSSESASTSVSVSAAMETVPTASALPSTTDAQASCGEDVGGWTTPVPTRVNASIALRSMAQTGSRLHFISAAHGNDSTGEIYFWDGSRIIDSSGRAADSGNRPYGTDPMDPTAAVKPFKRWAYVAPRARADADVGSKTSAVGSTNPVARGGFPDWWLFNRGENYDLSDDLLSFQREMNPLTVKASGSLAVPGGRSAAERQIVGAYGNLCAPRPRFIHPATGFVTRYANPATPQLKNVAYLSLHFDGHDRLAAGTYAGITLLSQTVASVDILFEDIWLDAAMSNISVKNSAQVTFRRVLVTDSYLKTNTSHVQGIFYGGSREGRLRIEESVLLRNGFTSGDPRAMTWPPKGNQIWDMFSRNLYISGESNSMESGMFDSVSMMGASGDQFRPGMRVERNFFYQGYVGLGGGGGYADAAGPTGTLTDNVLQRFIGTGTNNNLGQPGWGFQLGHGANAVVVTRNIVTGAQAAAGSPAFELTPLTADCFATRSNRITNNILDSGTALSAISVKDSGVAITGCPTGPVQGAVDNIASDNVLINSRTQDLKYVAAGVVAGKASDTLLQNNLLYSSRAAAAAALGWTGADRTLKTYLASKGVRVVSEDGFPEYFMLATQMRRGQWRPSWTSHEIVDYFRAGFKMQALN